MRSFKGLVTAMLVLSGAAGLLAASPIPTVPIRLSLALPAQNINFHDLDLRDANNHPIAAPYLRQRFEDLLNRELNRLLLENLTPARRIWLEKLSQPVDVFNVWWQRAAGVVHHWVWTAVGKVKRWWASTTQRSLNQESLTSAATQTSDKNFIALVLLLISSTRLLR